MGMAVSIDVRDTTREDPDAAAAVQAVVDWLHHVDAVFSPFDPESVISGMNRGRGVRTPAEVDVVLTLGERLRLDTDGYFDIRAGGNLDPCGIVKGWAVERASALLLGRGFGVHCINAGGDIRARGRSWQVGIAHPIVAGAFTDVVVVEDGAVATSGVAERGAHVINPRTGRAALDLASVTIVGPDLTFADVYATAALAMGLDAPAWLGTLEGYEALVIDAAGMVWCTEGWRSLGTRAPTPVH